MTALADGFFGMARRRSRATAPRNVRATVWGLRLVGAGVTQETHPPTTTLVDGCYFGTSWSLRVAISACPPRRPYVPKVDSGLEHRDFPESKVCTEYIRLRFAGPSFHPE